jgi:hypothetical protein
MDAVWLVVWLAAAIGSAFVAGRMAERRGRSFKTWAYVAALLLGPLAIPLVLLFPNLQGRMPS